MLIYGDWARVSYVLLLFEGFEGFEVVGRGLGILRTAREAYFGLL